MGRLQADRILFVGMTSRKAQGGGMIVYYTDHLFTECNIKNQYNKVIYKKYEKKTVSPHKTGVKDCTLVYFNKDLGIVYKSGLNETVRRINA